MDPKEIQCPKERHFLCVPLAWVGYATHGATPSSLATCMSIFFILI